MNKDPVKTLTCSCCGQATKGRQWWNRDTGFGLCPKCAKWIAEKLDKEEMEETYGSEGYHYDPL